MKLRKMMVTLLCTALLGNTSFVNRFPIFSKLDAYASSTTDKDEEDNMLFKLHNGITFGMSRSEVKKIEGDEGFTTEDVEDKTYGSKNYGKPDPKYLNVYGRIAGIDDSRILYYFDDSKLFFCRYFFSDGATNKSNEVVAADYVMISNALIEKYGEPEYTKKNGYKLYFGGHYKNQLVTGLDEVEFDKKCGDFSELADYEQWLLKQPDGSYVLIDHYILVSSINLHVVGYVTLPAEVVDKDEEEEEEPEDLVEKYNNMIDDL